MNLDKEKITKLLQDKGAMNHCHRCGNNTFTLVDGYSEFAIQKDVDKIQETVIGGPTVPFILIACDNCGVLIPHAMGALGLIPKEKKKNQ
jgi:hypothetical protein